MTNGKAKFNLVKKSNDITDKKGNVVVVSHQEIIQPDESKSDHIVLTKVRRNVDGTQSGNAKSLFIPKALSEDVIKAITLLSK